jgi:hypothetical protein
MDYTYEVYLTEFRQESLVYAGPIRVQDGKTSVSYYPIQSNRTERVRITLHGMSQEVSYYTGYTYTEWRPEIDPDLPWDKQDPIVKNFYRYMPDVSKNTEYRR